MARTYSLVGWDTYQHYGKRKAVPWVKLHRDMLTSLAWIKGDDKARLVMVGSMALAARYQNAIPLDWELLKNGLALKWTEEQFMQALRYLVASNFIALSEQDDSATLCQEEKSRVDKTPPSSPKGEFPEKFLALMAAYPSRGKAANPRKPAFDVWKRLIAAGEDADAMIRMAPTAAAPEKHGTEFVPQTVKWLKDERWKDAQLVVVTETADPETTRWRARIEGWLNGKAWMQNLWGPSPNEHGCQCPKDILAELIPLPTPSERALMAG